jgi:hypothetical protein
MSCGHAAGPVAAPDPTPTSVSASPTAAGKIAAIWDVEKADPGSRDVAVQFVAAACSVVRRIVVEESAERVVITLDQAGRNGKDCTEPFLRHRLVTLKAPLGDRALYDGGIAPPQLVRPGI